MGKSLLISSGATQTVPGSSSGFVYSLGNSSIQGINVETSRQVRFNKSGTLSSAFINLITNSLGASTLRVRKNGANGNQVVAITASTSGTFQDTSNTDSIAVSDLLNYSLTTGAGGSMTFNVMGCTFEPTTAGISYTPFVNVNPSTTTLSTASATRHFSLTGELVFTATTESQLQYEARIAGTLSGLSVYVVSNGRGTATTFRSRVNGANGNLVVSIPGGSGGLVTDTTNSDTIAVNDLICTSITTGTGSGAIGTQKVKVDFETATNDAVLTSQYITGIANATGVTSYAPIGGNLRSNTTESRVESILADAFTFSNLGTNVATNTLNVACTIRLRKNAANGNQVVTINAATTGFLEDTTNTDSCVAGDEVDYSIVTTGGGSGAISIRGIFMTSSTGAALQNLERLISDAFTVTEGMVMIRGLIQTRSDSLTFTESIPRLRGLNQLRSDSLTVTEASNRLRGLNQISSDSITISDTNSRLRLLLQSISDSLGISEATFMKIENKVRLLSHSVTLSEVINKLSNKNRASSDSVTLTGGAPIRTKGKLGIISDTISLTEDISRIKAVLRAFDDSLGISETITKLSNKSRSLSDSLGLSESISRLQSNIRTISESITLTESISRIQAVLRTITDQSIGLTESVDRLTGKLRTLSESVGFSHDLSWFSTRIRTILENISMVSDTVRTRMRPVSISDSLTLSHATERLTNKLRTISDSITFSDAVLGLRGFIKTFEDTLGEFEESIERLRGKIVEITTDSLTLDDHHTSLRAKLRSLSQELTIQESISRLTTRLRTINNSITFNHLFTNGSAKIKEIFESIELTHDNTRITGRIRTFTDSLVLDSLLSRLRSKLLFLDQLLSLEEDIHRQTSRLRGFTNNLNLTDLIEKGGANLVKTIMETLDFTHNNTRLTTRLRTISDSLQLTESISRLRGKLTSISESITFEDLAEQMKLKLATISNALSFSDSHSRLVERIRTFSESLSLSSDKLRITTRLRIITQGLSLTDSFIQTALSSIIKTMSEELSFVDGAYTRTKGKLKTVTESLGLASTIQHAKLYRIRFISESLNISHHQTSRLKTLILRSVDHNLTLSSTVNRFVKSAIKSFRMKIKRYRKLRYN